MLKSPPVLYYCKTYFLLHSRPVTILNFTLKLQQQKSSYGGDFANVSKSKWHKQVRFSPNVYNPYALFGITLFCILSISNTSKSANNSISTQEIFYNVNIAFQQSKQGSKQASDNCNVNREEFF